MDELITAPAHQLARMILDRSISSVEVLETYLQQIDALNDELNAVVTVNDAEARSQAEEADAALARDEVWGPLHGVPVTVKDAFETKGLRTTSSYPPLSEHVPQRDAVVVARLREAGAIILGKTNMSMLAADFQSDSPIFGRANNPWDLERTPGGSSGGSAAAVAAGLSPLDVGSDIGGSVRVPAHFCGVFSLKPTEHRVPSVGHIPDWTLPDGSDDGNGQVGVVQHMGTYGPLARSVEDLRLCLSIIEGPDERQAVLPPLPTQESRSQPLRNYRIAWTDSFADAPVNGETQRAIQNLASELEQLGCHVERRDPPAFNFAEAWQTWGEIVGAEMSASMPVKLRFLFSLLFMTSGRPPMDRGIVSGLWASRKHYHTTLARRWRLINEMERFLAEWDAWLCPVSSTPAFTHRKTGAAIEIDGEDVPYMLATASYTSVFNLTGNPVVVLLLTQSAQGLPIGVQVVGSRWRDRHLLNVAEAMTEATMGYRFPRHAR
ncbi:MAG: amidase [Candidatus Promineifilaceae bacterium]|nr:amidase [Candidatus Promineifilaceae bacterium]